jgi:ketosteroid isomerase-like protein
MASADPAMRVKTYWKHRESGEFERAARLFDEDAVYLQPQSYDGVSSIHSRAHLHEYLADYCDSQEVSYTNERVVRDGEQALLHGIVDGPGLDGVRVVAIFVVVKDGRIVHYHETSRDEAPGYSLT